MQNSKPINMTKVSPKEEQNYKLVKEGQEFQIGDLIHLVDDEYVKLNEDNQLLKTKVTKYSKVLRKSK
jgi:phosphotransferase system IIA component